MKLNSGLFFLLLLLTYSFALAQNPAIDIGKEKGLRMFVHNVCDYWSRLYIANGSDSAGTHASIGYVPCYSANGTHVHIDSLSPVIQVEYFDLDQNNYGGNEVKRFCLGDKDSVHCFSVSYDQFFNYCDSVIVSRINSFGSDSIADIQLNSNQILILRETDLSANFIVYDTAFSSVLYSAMLSIKPKMVSFMYPNYCVLGLDQNGAMVLNVIDMNTYSVIKDTVIMPDYIGPALFGSNYNTIHLLYEPGDTSIVYMEYNWNSNSFIDTVLFSGSDIGAGYWTANGIHFQPKSDPSGGGLDSSVIVFNTFTMTHQGIYPLYKKLRLVNAETSLNSGYFPYVFAIDADDQQGRYYLYENYGYNLVDSGYVAPNTNFFLPDFRCPVSINEYDDSKVELKTWPNPSSEFVNFSAYGMICGRDYKVDIVDIYGLVLYEAQVHAKMTLTLPVENLKSGIYFIRIHTLKGFVVQKFIKA